MKKVYNLGTKNHKLLYNHWIEAWLVSDGKKWSETCKKVFLVT